MMERICIGSRMGRAHTCVGRARESARTIENVFPPSRGVTTPEAIPTVESDTNLSSACRALREAVRRFEQLRSLRSGDPEPALAVRQCLATGRWSLLDHFERDGSRYLVVRRNPPRAKRPLDLTQAERRVVAWAARGTPTKEIAYALGISDATVRVLILRAVRKCDVRDRSELIELWNGTSRPGEAIASDRNGMRKG